MGLHRPARVTRRPRVRVLWLPLPGQAAGLAVLVAALTSVPLVLGSAAQGAWDLAEARSTAVQLGTTSTSAARTDDLDLAPQELQFVAAGPVSAAAAFDVAVQEASVAAGLGDPVGLARLQEATTTGAPGSGERVRTVLLHREGAADRVEVLAGAPTADGVLVPRSLATTAGVGPGDVVTTQPRQGPPLELRVSGVYADLVDPLPAWWQGQTSLFLPAPDPSPRAERLPTAVVLAPRDVVLSAADTTLGVAVLEWWSPLAAGADVDTARLADRRTDRFAVDLADPSGSVATAVVQQGFPRPRPTSDLGESVELVDATVQQLAAPVRAVGLTGAAAALGLVGAWAAQRLRRREHEVTSLVTRGLSPARAAGQVLREAALPVAVGAVLGTGAAVLLVRALGPAPDLAAGVWPSVAGGAGAGVLAAAGAVALVTAVLVARSSALAPGPLAQLLGRVPWLPVAATVAVLTAVPVVTGGAGSRDVDLVTLALPVLATLVLAGGLTALLPLLGRALAGPVRRLPVAAQLVTRRVLAAPGSTRLVVVTTAVSLGLVVHAGVLADSTARAVQVTASVAAPADLVIPLSGLPDDPGPLPEGAGVVDRDQDLVLTPGGAEVDLLGVDPTGLPGSVRLDPALGPRPLPDLLADLVPDPDGDGRVPVVLAGDVPGVGPGSELEAALGSFYALPVRVVDQVTAFPGQQSRRPLLVGSAAVLAAALDQQGRDPGRVLDHEVWAAGDLEEVGPALDAAGLRFDPETVISSPDLAGQPQVVASRWSMDYLRAVAVGAAVLGLAGLVGHAAAQQRRRTVAALLLSRAGMRRRTSDLVAGGEVGLLAGLSAVVAVAGALPAAVLVLPLVDPVPDLPPGTVLQVPWATLAALAGGLAAASVVAAVTVGRRARSSAGGQVLRDAG